MQPAAWQARETHTMAPRVWISKFKTETFLKAVWYAFWFLVFWLAGKEAVWLNGLEAGPILPISISGILTSSKFWIDRQSLERENEQRAMIRLLTLLGARARIIDKNHPVPRDGVNLPLWIALLAEDPGDFDDYLSGISHSPYTKRLDDLLMDARAYARNHGLQRHLERLDNAVIAAARSVDGHPRVDLLFGIRETLLNHVAGRYLDGATHPTALVAAINSIEVDLPPGSGVAIFLQRVAVELGFEGQHPLFNLNWTEVESWLKRSPPENLDDLFGQSGIKVKMEIPNVLRKALEREHEAKKYDGGKTYYD